MGVNASIVPSSEGRGNSAVRQASTGTSESPAIRSDRVTNGSPYGSIRIPSRDLGSQYGKARDPFG
jgi:hypothetical protein